MITYRKRPVEVKAVFFDGSQESLYAIARMACYETPYELTDDYEGTDMESVWLPARPGSHDLGLAISGKDWVVWENEALRVVQRETFNRDYEEVPA